MSVNFHSEDDSSVMVCDECGHEVDDDHYYDMVAHDEEHAVERDRVAALPATVILFHEKVYTVLQKSTDGIYLGAASTLSLDTARVIAAALV